MTLLITLANIVFPILKISIGLKTFTNQSLFSDAIVTWSSSSSLNRPTSYSRHRLSSDSVSGLLRFCARIIRWRKFQYQTHCFVLKDIENISSCAHCKVVYLSFKYFFHLFYSENAAMMGSEHTFQYLLMQSSLVLFVRKKIPTAKKFPPKF